MSPLVFALALLAQQPRPAVGPTVADVRIRITGEYARVAESGILPLDRQGLQATATVVAVDAAGRPVSVARLAPHWSSSDANVVSIHGSATGASTMLVAQQDGRATVTVTVAGRTASIPVVVGEARQGIAASELTPKFRVARLEVLASRGSAGPSAEAVAGGLHIRENGHGARLEARAFAADGTAIPLDNFPITWSTGDARIVELYQTGRHETQTTAHEPGSTSITASIQGITATANVEVIAGDVELGPLAEPTVVASAAGRAEILTTAATTTSATTTTPTISMIARSDMPVASAGVRATSFGAAPTGVGASASGAMSATVRWTPAPGASGHVVAWAGRADGPFAVVDSVAGTASSALITRIPPGTIYFTVAAKYSDRAGGTSAPLAVVVPAGRQPTNFRATSAPGYVRLEWDSIPEATGYALTRMDGGAAPALDDHFPARAQPLLRRRSFVDATGPGTTAGYVLSAMYRALDGRDYGGDAAAMPRTPATPLPLDSAADFDIRVSGYLIQSGSLYAKYDVSPLAYGWVSAIAVEMLGPAGWTHVLGDTFDWTSANPARRAVPGGGRTGIIAIDWNIPRCDNAYVYRLKVTWSAGGATSSQQTVAERRSRPFTVTADAPGLGCHKSVP